MALLKFNRPEKLNAMGGTMMAETVADLNSLNSGDYRIRALVVTGEGRAFCAGGDVTGFPGANLDRVQRPWRRPHAEGSAITAMRNCDVTLGVD